MSKMRPQTAQDARYNEYLTKVNESKQTFYQQTKFNPHWQRFGLFSYCPGYSVTDVRYNIKKPKDRNDDGTIKIGQKNFNTDPLKNGAVFQKPGYLHEGDVYEDKFRMYEQEKKDKQSKMQALHSNAFRPNGTYKELIGTGFEHKQEYNHKAYDTRNPDGSVKKDQSNFQCGPAKKGNSCFIGFEKFPQYMIDPYENAQEMSKKSHQATQNLKSNRNWRPGTTKGRNFSTHRELYGEVQINPTRQKERDTSWMPNHNKAFMPTNPAKKSTIDKTLQKFPNYAEEGEYNKRPKSAQGQWMHTHNWKTRPTPSIVQNFRNRNTTFK